MICALLFLGSLLAAPAPPGAPPAAPRVAAPAHTPAHDPHRADLLVPQADQDLSAFRYDTEVFGWSQNFDEVGSVVMEVARGPKGRHRGEAYMLVYRLGEWLPKHNIICHNITHVDLPDNPIPMEQAQDYLWVIEFSYLQMWPHRPIRRIRPGFMKVSPITAFLPESFKLPPVPRAPRGPEAPDVPALVAPNRRGAAVPDEVSPKQPLCTSAPAPRPGAEGEARCRPWLGFILEWRGKRRLQPFVPFDMGARCSVLRRGEAPRTYWGRRDIAASMVRVDFSASPGNEESARFLGSAAWQLAKNPTLELVGGPLAPADVSRLTAAVRQMGGRLVAGAGAGTGGPLRIRGPRELLAWGAYLAEDLHLPVVRYVVDAARPDVLVWERAQDGDAEAASLFDGEALPQDTAPTNDPPPPTTVPAPAERPAPEVPPQVPPSPRPSPAGTPERAVPKARYLDDWKM